MKHRTYPLKITSPPFPASLGRACFLASARVRSAADWSKSWAWHCWETRVKRKARVVVECAIFLRWSMRVVSWNAAGLVDSLSAPIARQGQTRLVDALARPGSPMRVMLWYDDDWQYMFACWTESETALQHPDPHNTSSTVGNVAPAWSVIMRVINWIYYWAFPFI